MSRIGLAFSCFFRILTGKRLPAEAAALVDVPQALPAPALPVPEVKAPAVKPADKPADRPAKREGQPQARDGALTVLAMLQREGRLIDFLREPIDQFTDAEIGAAARDVHRGCKKVLDQVLTLEAVMPGQEEARVSVPAGFDPSEIRLLGETNGQPPFAGTLRHHGWRATSTKLPQLTEGVDRAVLAPAEVELA